MGQLLLRDVDFELVRLLRKRAAKNGRTQEEEHRAILDSVLRADRRNAEARMQGLFAGLQASGLFTPPAPPLAPPADDAG